MNQLNPIYTEKTECQDCYKCLRECSVKAIKVEGGRAAVVPELCVLCGHCVRVCPSNAKRVRPDLPRVRRLLESGRRVIVSLAPSFAAEFPGIPGERIVAALRRLGFSAVSETARGADLVADRVAREMREWKGAGRVWISSACPTVVGFISTYRPELTSSVSDLYSPLLAHARELRALWGDEAAIVFIGPCVSKKREADEHRALVDVALDFMDLRQLLEEAGIQLDTLTPGPEDRFVPERAGSGTLYPVDGGMIEALNRHNPPANALSMSFSGLEAIAEALNTLEDLTLDRPLFLECLACPGGCVNGPRTTCDAGTVRKRLSVLDYARSARDGRVDARLELTGALAWSAGQVESYEPSLIAEALERTGKYGPADEMNCGGCGYDTCRDFARAMLSGRAEPAMCVSYMRKMAQKKANGLMRAMPSGVVIVDKDLRVVECNENFARLLGGEARMLWDARPGLEGADLERIVPFADLFHEILDGNETIEKEVRLGKRILHATIFCIERSGLAGGVFQDVTEPSVRKHRVVSQARKVIDRNLAVVQKIAYLLGENAAETEATLTSIIESFGDGEDIDG